MTPLIILSLFGVALLLPSLSGDDSDDTPDQMDEVEEPQPEIANLDTETPTTPTAPATLDGTTQNDTLTTSTPQTVNGYSGADTITAEGGANGSTLFGGRDPDTFNIFANNVTANGERGGDTFNIRGREVTANGNSGDDTFNFSGDLANLNGAAGDDVFNGTGEFTRIDGGDGNDTISAGGGEILLRGNEGDDTIIFGGTSPGSDAIGDGGNDVLIARNLGGGVAGDMYGGDGDDTLSVDPENLNQNEEIELFGQAGNDVLTNNSGSNDIYLGGGEGSDTLNVSFDVNDNGDGGRLQGGLDADTFNIEMNIAETTADDLRGSETMIRDFTKGEDVLNLVIDAPADGAYTFGDITIVEDEEGASFGSLTEIRVSFNSAIEGERPIESIIRLFGISELTLDDFVVTMR